MKTYIFFLLESDFSFFVLFAFFTWFLGLYISVAIALSFSLFAGSISFIISVVLGLALFVDGVKELCNDYKKYKNRK